jgi:hypothetical protein
MRNDWSKVQEVLGPALPNLWQTLGIVGGILGLLWLTLRLRAWFRDDAVDDDGAMELLPELRELHREGGLTAEEFRFITTRLARTSSGGGVPRTKVTVAQTPPTTEAAENAAAEPTEKSPQGCCDQPDAESSGHTSDDASPRAQDAPRVDTP